MAEVDQYLLPTERPVALAHLHWAVLLPQGTALVGSWLIWLVLLRFAGNDYIAGAAAVYFVLSLTWMGWLVVDWLVEQIAVTDKRILKVSGILTKRVSVMPLRKVTDLTFERTPLGRVLGYGTFVLESAGQDQALHRIDHLSRPDEFYKRLSMQIFGPKGLRPDQLLDPEEIDLDGDSSDPDHDFGPTTQYGPRSSTARLPRV